MACLKGTVALTTFTQLIVPYNVVPVLLDFPHFYKERWKSGIFTYSYWFSNIDGDFKYFKDLSRTNNPYLSERLCPHLLFNKLFNRCTKLKIQKEWTVTEYKAGLPIPFPAMQLLSPETGPITTFFHDLCTYTSLGTPSLHVYTNGDTLATHFLNLTFLTKNTVPMIAPHQCIQSCLLLSFPLDESTNASLTRVYHSACLCYCKPCFISHVVYICRLNP